MSTGEVLFWVGITFFGTGLYFAVERENKKNKKLLVWVTICIGVVLMFPAAKHFGEKAVAAKSPSTPSQQNTQAGNNNNAGNVTQSGDHNTAVIGNDNRVGNTYNITKEPTNSGWLRPGHEPTPQNTCRTAPQANDLLVLFGGNIGWEYGASQLSLPVLTIKNHPVLTLNRNKSGQIAISGEVFNSRDDAVVIIENNKFTTSNEAFIVSSTRSTLRVTVKHLNETVLNVNYLNPGAVRIMGHFYYQGKEVFAKDDETIINTNHFGGGNCSVNPGRGIFGVD
ncbi:MAG: hypothetical protein WA485_15370 [Candidatus Sulfotelmatobacter sp.]